MMRKYQSHKKTRRNVSGTETEFRVRTPRRNDGEIMGLVEALHGGKRMTVKCADGKIRMCRVSGKMKRIWVRNGDYVILKPWELEGDKKADIVWRYRQTEAEWLQNNGFLNEI